METAPGIISRLKESFITIKQNLRNQMADCDFFPDDPACQSPAEGNAEGMEGKSEYYMQVLEDEHDFLNMYGGMGFWAKLGFLAVAGKGVVYNALQIWRYIDLED